MSAIRVLILPDTYRDSVFLMKLSSQARKDSGASQVSAMMGTARNKELFAASGLLTPEVDGARPDDLVVAVEAGQDRVEAALDLVRSLLEQASGRTAGADVSVAYVPQSLAEAAKIDPKLNLAVISVAGDYARYEAARALGLGMDVMLYSDNISLEDEAALKNLARRKNLLVMGPDCGTSIIGGVPLGFANSVRQGDIGLIAASGTGLQEVTCLLDRFGAGVSQAYGTGGRDLKDAIGGLTALSALDRLIDDPQTRRIGILGKPPGPKTRAMLADRIRALSKPVAVHYLGTDDYGPEDAAGIPHAGDLTLFAVLLARGEGAGTLLEEPNPLPARREGWLRGLFSGGTLCQEAAELAAPFLGSGLYSNLPINGFGLLAARDPSQGHAFWDFGHDEFTVGRPHPMMAPELRMEHLIRELCDPQVGLVLLDLVIGYGAASGQAELVVEALEEAAMRSQGASREKIVVASVCGTEQDSPSRSVQVEILRAGGVIVQGSNAQAARWAAMAVSGNQLAAQAGQTR